jgi:hypothetical protein
VTEIHLVDWTVEEARLLAAERIQARDEVRIPSLDEILIWPKSDPPIPTVAASKTAPTVPQSTYDGVVTVPKDGPSSPVLVSVSFSISTDIQNQPSASFGATTASKSPLPAKPDTPVMVLDRDRMIGLRWVLRDIKGKRLRLFPISQDDLQTLTAMGLVETRDGNLIVTREGNRAIDVSWALASGTDVTN